jgi:hypothetical protein
MALQFLQMAAQAAPAVMQILGAFKGSDKPKIQPMPESERYAISLLKALAEPNNSLLKQIQAEEFRGLRSGVQSDIKSKVLADRRENSMGRAPVFFDPERADENINYQISRGTPLLQQQSQQNAIQRILQAAGVGGYAGAESYRQQNYYGALAEQSKGKILQGGVTGRIGQGTDALQKILDIFSKGMDGRPSWEREPYGPPKTFYNQMRYNA